MSGRWVDAGSEVGTQLLRLRAIDFEVIVEKGNRLDVGPKLGHRILDRFDGQAGRVDECKSELWGRHLILPAWPERLVVAVLPGSGATHGSIIGKSVEMQIAKVPEKFGKGDMRGLVAPAAAANAVSAGAMVPLLSLGVPGSGATAVLLGDFMMWGCNPARF